MVSSDKFVSARNRRRPMEQFSCDLGDGDRLHLLYCPPDELFSAYRRQLVERWEIMTKSYGMLSSVAERSR